MSRDSDLDRRTFLRATAAAALAGSTALAGCSSASSDAGNDGDTQAPDASGGGDGGDSSGSNGGSGGGSTDFGGWFDDTSNFDGVVDETGTERVTVEVGATGNDGNFAFDPPAIRVSEGTTVVWKWTGEGGSHDVVAADGSFEADLNGTAGHTFEHTFDASGTTKYYCMPHKSMGMKGAVVVE